MKFRFSRRRSWIHKGFGSWASSLLVLFLDFNSYEYYSSPKGLRVLIYRHTMQNAPETRRARAESPQNRLSA